MVMRPTDALLALGAAARLTRFVISDHLGHWWVKEPVDAAMERYEASHSEEPWWWRYRSGLECPFCVGFWLGTGVLASYALTYRSPRLRSIWRFATSALALNYVAAHTAIRLGDFDTEEDDDE